MRSLFLLGILTLFADAARADVGGPQNLNFEKGTVGETPEGWFAPEPGTMAGYTAVLSETNPKEGKRCAVVSRKGNDQPQGFGNLMQSFDATPWRGKRIRLKAWVRADVNGEGNQAQLWLRVDRKDEQEGFFDNMGDRPITKKDWTEYEIIGEVAADAEQIAIGLMLIGNGLAAIDGVTIDQAGKAGEGDEPAKALTDRQLDNLIAFAKLYGYVRYFHPSDESAAANWETFLIEGVGRVKNAKTPAELAVTLQKLFDPIAPTVKVVAGNKEMAVEPLPEKATLIAWSHFGVGAGGKASMYWSKRVEKGKEPFPDPAKPHVADLGGGVSCLVPLVLQKLNGATEPKATAKAEASLKPAGFRPSGNDRATRLADVIIAWNIFQHFYPYFDVVKVDWPAELKKALTTAATDTNEREFHLTLKRLVAALKDGHGGVYFQSRGEFTPLPISWDWIEDKLVITRVPAKYAEEMKAGDVVVKINGRSVKEVLAEQESLISGATSQWIRFNALRALRHGAKDSEVALEIQRRAGVSKTVKVVRDAEGLEPEDLAEAKPQKVEEVQPGIMYLDIDRCDDKDFQKALPKLEAAKGIIFDLRGYPSKFGTAPIGYLTNEAVTCAQWHIPKTIYPDRKDVTFQFSNWKVPPAKPKWEAKVAFITDGRAISYAETYLGIIEHYKLAAIVGGPTAGTNGNVNPFTLPGGYNVSWTGMRVLKHDGSKHHGVGIQPTVPVKRTIQGVKDGKDELLEKAIETVKP